MDVHKSMMIMSTREKEKEEKEGYEMRR